jgi:hypothetical protein
MIGVALASLQSLFPLYPSPVLKLCQLKRKVSSGTQRGGDLGVTANENAFSVVMFKKISNPNLPLGISREFFTSILIYPNSEARAKAKKRFASLLSSQCYQVLAITAPMFDVDDPTMLSHFIVGAALYMLDNKYGTFINCLGVSLNGNPEVCTLSNPFFVELSDCNLLSEISTFSRPEPKPRRDLPLFFQVNTTRSWQLLPLCLTWMTQLC